MRVVEVLHLMQTNIKVSELTGEAELEIIKYSHDEIRILLCKGSGFCAKVTDGFFSVCDNEHYTITQGVANARVAQVMPENGVLSFEVLPTGVPMEIIIRKNKA